jgi:putative membrane protein
MLPMLIQWFVMSLILLLIAKLLPGIVIQDMGIALMSALVLGAINVLIRPLVMLLALPLNILTLGLFAFIINALMFALAAWIVPGFEVSNFMTALLGSLLLALFTGIFGMFYKNTTKTI